ncbi:MAG: hypothetical protein IJU56_08530 [Clostridia bacterium]|nr:hypothetical protein [Clostridia bacterium]
MTEIRPQRLFVFHCNSASKKEWTKKEKTLVYGERGQPFARQARKPLSFRLSLTNGDGSMGKVCAYTNSIQKKNSVCAFS